MKEAFSTKSHCQYTLSTNLSKISHGQTTVFNGLLDSTFRLLNMQRETRGQICYAYYILSDSD